jgi:hypothetical protein
MKDRGKDRSDGKTRKTDVATGCPYGKQRILGIEIGNTRSQFVENSIWKRLRTYRKAGYAINE